MKGPLLVAVVLVAGCAGPAGNGTVEASESDSPTTSMSESGTFDRSKCPYGAHWPPNCDWPMASLYIGLDDGAVAIPFPHLDRCLSSEVWMDEGEASQTRGEAGLLDTGRGPAYEVRTDGSGRMTATLLLNTTSHAECQTLRYDPWSIDPDATNDTIEVYALEPASNLYLSIMWGTVCGSQLLYRAPALQPGWTNLTAERGAWCK